METFHVCVWAPFVEEMPCVRFIAYFLWEPTGFRSFITLHVGIDHPKRECTNRETRPTLGANIFQMLESRQESATATVPITEFWREAHAKSCQSKRVLRLVLRAGEKVQRQSSVHWQTVYQKTEQLYKVSTLCLDDHVTSRRRNWKQLESCPTCAHRYELVDQTFFGQ